MTFKEFVGNTRAVESLRRLVSAERLPQALLLAGPRGVGKFTLAVLLARAANCRKTPGEICGQCENCRALAPLDDLAALNRDLRLVIEQDMYPAPGGSAKAIATRTRHYFTSLGLPPAED